jgi:hypothetical protein
VTYLKLRRVWESVVEIWEFMWWRHSNSYDLQPNHKTRGMRVMEARKHKENEI